MKGVAMSRRKRRSKKAGLQGRPNQREEEAQQRKRWRACAICGRDLAKRQPVIRPAFRFQGLGEQDLGQGPEFSAGTEICTRHEIVFDVAAGKPKAVYAGDAKGGAA